MLHRYARIHGIHTCPSTPSIPCLFWCFTEKATGAWYLPDRHRTWLIFLEFGLVSFDPHCFLPNCNRRVTGRSHSVEESIRTFIEIQCQQPAMKPHTPSPSTDESHINRHSFPMNTQVTMQKYSSRQCPTIFTGSDEVSTTAQQPDCTCTHEHIKHSTSTPRPACSTGIMQYTAQRPA